MVSSAGAAAKLADLDCDIGRTYMRLKSEFTRGPGRGDTCHLSVLDETLPD